MCEIFCAAERLLTSQVDNEINYNNNKHSFRSNTKGYESKPHWTDSQNSDITVPSGRELYHLLFSLQEANPETFGHTLVFVRAMMAQSVQRWATG
jgi:hypothetical protein